jgi:hypothetical protein
MLLAYLAEWYRNLSKSSKLFRAFLIRLDGFLFLPLLGKLQPHFLILHYA